MIALGLLFLTWSPVSRIGALWPYSYLVTPVILLTVLGLLMVAAWIWQHDRWLALAVGWYSVLSCRTGSDVALAAALVFAAGAGALTVLRQYRIPRWVRYALVASAVLEILYAQGQRYGIDPFMAWPNHRVLATGTFGNVRYLGAMVALVVPWTPPLLLPVMAGGLILSQSWLAAGAAVLGLFVKGGGRCLLGSASRVTTAPLLMLGGGAVLGVLAATRTLDPQTFWTRVATWKLAATLMPGHWWIGYGPGGWLEQIPLRQLGGEIFFQGHSEPLQWVFEAGILGAVLLLGWLWSVRASWPGLLPVLALSCFLHILHWPTLAPAVVLVVALALNRQDEIRRRCLA